MWKYLLGGYAVIGIGFTVRDYRQQQLRLASQMANDAAHGTVATYGHPKVNLTLTIGWLPMVLVGLGGGEL